VSGPNGGPDTTKPFRRSAPLWISRSGSLSGGLRGIGHSRQDRPNCVGRRSDYWARPLHAIVTIFETDNVIELSGACLEDDRVLQCRHAVPGAGAEMDCLPGEQLE